MTDPLSSGTDRPLSTDPLHPLSKVIALKLAAELREHPEHWSQLRGCGSSGRDAKGLSVPARDPAACAWCIEGLIQREAGPSYPHRILRDFADTVGVNQLFSWNDAPKRTLQDVIELCDKVAAS